MLNLRILTFRKQTGWLKAWDNRGQLHVLFVVVRIGDLNPGHPHPNPRLRQLRSPHRIYKQYIMNKVMN